MAGLNIGELQPVTNHGHDVEGRLIRQDTHGFTMTDAQGRRGMLVFAHLPDARSVRDALYDATWDAGEDLEEVKFIAEGHIFGYVYFTDSTRAEQARQALAGAPKGTWRRDLA